MEKLHSAVELREIAKDLQAGRIYCDRHCRSAKDVQLAFPILSFLDDVALRRVAKRLGGTAGGGMVYEYLEKASPRSINGMPMFFSCQLLTPVEARYVLQKVEEIEQALERI